MNLSILQNPDFAEIDRHFAAFVGEHGGGELPEIAAALVSRNVRQGHVCLDLREPVKLPQPDAQLEWPGVKTWTDALKKSRAVGTEASESPLVLEAQRRLYLRRYWEYEQTVAEQILQRCDTRVPSDSDDPDLQAVAVRRALERRFLVISGGPGTGKTTTVLKILEEILGRPGGEALRVALAAPTGKAAARLQETLQGRNSAVAGRLPKSASTVHRLLRMRPGSIYSPHNASNPLPLDLLIVDEASMVPLAMMAKLLDAIPKQARVILLGDHHQLASVEAGAILGDIAEAAENSAGPLQGSLVVLRTNYRFGRESTLLEVCNLVREGASDKVLEVLRGGERDDLRARKAPRAADLPAALTARIVEGYGKYLAEKNPAKALEEFQKFRVLCALRRGPYGVEGLNAAIIGILRDQGLITGAAKAFAGLPILVTSNDYQLRLFNGDTGIVLPDAQGSLVAWFTDLERGLRHFPISRLPEHEPAFAMTVHKTQGSEYDNVLLLLPDRESPVLTRELVYTGLTRARKCVEIWYSEAVLREAILRRVQRASGLREKLCRARKSG